MFLIYNMSGKRGDEMERGREKKNRHEKRENDRKVTNCFTACEFSWKSQTAAAYQIE